MTIITRNLPSLKNSKVCSGRTNSDGHLLSLGDFRISSDGSSRGHGRSLIHSLRSGTDVCKSRGTVVRLVRISESLVGRYLQDGGTNRSGGRLQSCGTGTPRKSIVRTIS